MQVEALKELCFKIKKQKAVCEEKAKELKEENGEYTKLTNEGLVHLEALKLKNFDFGEGKITIATRWSARVIDKYALAEYMKKRDKFESMFSFNAAAANTYFKEEMEAAVERGDVDFVVDGMSEPTCFKQVKLLK